MIIEDLLAKRNMTKYRLAVAAGAMLGTFEVAGKTKIVCACRDYSLSSRQ